MGFATSGCNAIEILSDNYVNICYWRLSQVLEHQYAYMVAKVDEDQKQLHYHQAAFTVPIDAVVNAVNCILKE